MLDTRVSVELNIGMPYSGSFGGQCRSKIEVPRDVRNSKGP